jgi:hypothetical protein
MGMACSVYYLELVAQKFPLKNKSLLVLLPLIGEQKSVLVGRKGV